MSDSWITLCGNLQEQVTLLTRERDELRKDLDTATGMFVRCEQEVKRWKKMTDSNADERDKLFVEVERLKAELSVAEGSRQNCLDQAAPLRAEVERLKEVIYEMNKGEDL